MNAIEELREIAERIYDGSSGSVRDSQRMLEIACSIEETSQLDRIEEMLKQLTTGEFRGELNRIESKLDKLLKDKVHACTIGGH